MRRIGKRGDMNALVVSKGAAACDRGVHVEGRHVDYDAGDEHALEQYPYRYGVSGKAVEEVGRTVERIHDKGRSIADCRIRRAFLRDYDGARDISQDDFANRLFGG